MSQLTSLAKNLPFAGLGFRIWPLANQVLGRLRNVQLAVFRDTLPGCRPGNRREMEIPRAFGYDLLVMQAREIRGQ